MTSTPKMIRVLVVDDSALMRKLIPQMLERDTDPRCRHRDGRRIRPEEDRGARPDAITLDLEMPRMDGIETLRQIMQQQRVPVVVVSAHTQRRRQHDLQGAAYGRLRFCRQAAGCPRPTAWTRSPAELIAKIKAAVSQPFRRRPCRPESRAAQTQAEFAPGIRPGSKVVAIGISTGRPQFAGVHACHSSRRSFPRPSWWCSTCPTDSPRPSRAA